MKKLAGIIFLFAFHPSYSQFHPGSFALGANESVLQQNFANSRTGNSTSGTSSGHTTNIVLGISGTVFIAPTVAIGLNLFESFYSDPTIITQQNSTYGLALLMKKFYPVTSAFGFVTGTAPSYQYGENDRPLNTAYHQPQHSEIISLPVSGGAYYLVYQSIAVEATYNLLSMNYQKQWNDANLAINEKSMEGHSLNMNLNVPNSLSPNNFNFTLIWYFNLKR
jgi:hypothetical protein